MKIGLRLRGGPLLQNNKELNGWIDGTAVISLDRRQGIRNASRSLAEAMLYMKFIQGIPVLPSPEAWRIPCI